MAFTAIAAVCVLLRVIARLKAKVPVWWDDFIVGLSFVRTDIWAIPFSDITTIFKAWYSLFVIYITFRDFVRLSILLFYQRIFGHVPLARRLIQFSFVLIITCCIAFDFAILFGCTPINYFWKAWEGRGRGSCISTHDIFWAGAFVTIAIDIWVMLVPIPFILRLNLSLRKKILSAIMFTFGILSLDYLNGVP
ncbi:hypothetical protein SLS53_009378 [Cytospora paraplurivora]|uniref:Rhodopsin domain-containing protein n=1 Tax=Cytospora paraplurivora TaxID=2898453 RepID=A0AAN9TY51_9PEZI